VKVIVGDVDPSDPTYPSDEPSEDTDEDASIPEDAENLALVRNIQPPSAQSAPIPIQATKSLPMASSLQIRISPLHITATRIGSALT
jgi:hypothetical protein